MPTTWKQLAFSDDIVPYTGAVANVDLGAHTLTGDQLISTHVTGVVAPLVVTSIARVANLNADMVDGEHSASFLVTSAGLNGSPVMAGTTLVVTSGQVISATPAGPLTVQSAGTAYTLTNSSQLLTFGTTSPSLTISAAGTYLIRSHVQTNLVGATMAANRNITFVIHRTNNTPWDVSPKAQVIKTDITSLKAYTLPIGAIPEFVYTTANTNDVLEIWGFIDTVPTAGSISIVDAQIIAVRLY
jgi:hypothetical protein